MSEFEYALVFYHHGNKLRPEIPAFRLGVQKSLEAIDNAIGGQFTRVTLYIMFLEVPVEPGPMYMMLMFEIDCNFWNFNIDLKLKQRSITE